MPNMLKVFKNYKLLQKMSSIIIWQMDSHQEVAKNQ